jgi:hypothetical protein
MEKNCLYCEAHFTTNRRNKKYCSGNCKQIAYLKRNGLIFSGISEATHVKYDAPTIVKEQNVKHPSMQTAVKDGMKKIETQSVKYISEEPTVKDETKNRETEPVKYVSEPLGVKAVRQTDNDSAKNNPVKHVSEATPDNKVIEVMLARFMMSMEQKFNEAIESVKQELVVKYGSPVVKPHFTESESVKNETTVKQETPSVKAAFTDSENTKQVCNLVGFDGVINPVPTIETKINYYNPCENIVVKYATETQNTVASVKDDGNKQEMYFTLQAVKETEPSNSSSEENKASDILILSKVEPAKLFLSDAEQHETEKQEINIRANEEPKKQIQEEQTGNDEHTEEQNQHEVKCIELPDNDEINEQNLFEPKQNEEMLESEAELETEEVIEENEEQQTEELETEEEAEQEPVIENEPSAKATRIQELEKQLHELKSELQNKKATPIQKEEPKEKPEAKYHWVESKIVALMENNYESQISERLFENSLRGGNYEQIESMNWINLRLRCLIESIIKLSNYSFVDRHTLFCITDAFNCLVKSTAHQTLPEKYPYKELIKELCIKLNNLARNNANAETVKFVLPMKRKASLIASRYEMLKYVPAVKFSELDFTETNSLYSLKTSEDKTDRNKKENKDWKIRFKALKKQQQLKAA